MNSRDKARWRVGMRLTEADVEEIAEMYLNNKQYRRALRDLEEQLETADALNDLLKQRIKEWGVK